MPDKQVSRVVLWGGLLAGFVITTAIVAIVRGVESSALLYLWVLYAVCSSPLLIQDVPNGRYAILWIILAMYFVLYAANDCLALLAGAALPERGRVYLAELAIVIGAVCLIFGYRVAARRDSVLKAKTGNVEWPAATIVWVGMILWVLGIVATLYWQIKLQTHSFNLAYVSPGLGMVITIGRMVQPLGTALLAYQTVKSDSKRMLILMLLLLLVEFVVGFICDSKELSIRGMIVLLAAKWLMQGRVPKVWLLIAAVVAILSFPVFQAYRYEVLGVRGQAREQAARNLKENLAIAVRAITEPGAYGSSAGPGFIGRVSLKSNMELVIDRVGSEAVYQNGYTYLLFLEGFVPRILWPDKPDTSVGQLFNRELHISMFRDVYISPSYLGEFYWNFGWPGVFLGMFMLGGLLGMIGRRVAMSEGVTVTRFLVMLLTVYSFCMRFEGGMALEALVWVRSLVAVAALHFLFARKESDSSEVSHETQNEESGLPVPQAAFSNLMR